MQTVRAGGTRTCGSQPPEKHRQDDVSAVGVAQHSIYKDSHSMLQEDGLTWSEIASVIAVILSIIVASWTIIGGVLLWKNKRPLLFHEMYRSEQSKLIRFKMARLVIWDRNGKAIVDEEVDKEREEDYTPGIVFTLLNRSSEAIEIYEIAFSHLSTNTKQDYFRIASSVQMPYLLKPYDYQNFRVAINRDHSWEFLTTWRNRKFPSGAGFILHAYSLRTSQKVVVRTSKGTVKAYIRGFTRLENTRRKMAKYWMFSRTLNRFRKNPNISKAPRLLSIENWWE